MRELPEPALYDEDSDIYGWIRSQVLAIQKQAYEDGLRDARNVADMAHKNTGGVTEFDNGWASAALQISQAIDMLTASQKPRCELCGYQHGHAIGCANNPVDIALKAASQKEAP
jgi:hypothetical protein